MNSPAPLLSWRETDCSPLLLSQHPHLLFPAAIKCTVLLNPLTCDRIRIGSGASRGVYITQRRVQLESKSTLSHHDLLGEIRMKRKDE